MGVDVATLLLLPRPRDRKWKAGATWKGTGEHGEGKGEELHPEIVEETQNAVDQSDESVELTAPADETVGDEEVDRELGDLLQEDPHPLQSRRRPA